MEEVSNSLLFRKRDRMNKFSIIFIKDSHASVRQYSMSYRLFFVCGFLFISSVIALGSLYYSQHQKIVAQQYRLEKNETLQANMQKEIGGFAEKEKRLKFLESYLEELKWTAYKSENSLKKYVAQYKTSINKLTGLHRYICQTMETDCVVNIDNPQRVPTWTEADQVSAWMEKAQTNFETLAKTVADFNEKKITIEDQEKTISRLELRISQIEAQMKRHLQLLKDKEIAIGHFSSRIHEVTGIKIDLAEQFMPKTDNFENEKGRGGPSVSDHAVDFADFSEFSYLQRYLEETAQYYENIVKSIDKLSKSIDQDSRLWQNTPTIRPVKTRSISDRFGRRVHPVTRKPDYHRGVDFPAKTGTSVYTPADGVVTRAARWGGCGRFIEIQHGLGFYKNKRKKVYFTTRYCHLHRIKVKKGQRVKRGQIIGLVGNTGISTGPHLHYEIILNKNDKKYVDPLNLIYHFESHLKN